jgi:hypothetical protein
MLPNNLLPDGALSAMRSIALQFMQEPVTIFEPILTYDTYGQQIVTSGTLVQVSGYVGRASGADRELVKRDDGNAFYHSGIETRQFATVLVPVDTELSTTHVILIKEKPYQVVWHTDDGMRGVMPYTKCVCVSITRLDEMYRYQQQTGGIP